MEIKPLASNSKANCIYLSDGVTPLLLDAGLRFRETQRALSFQVSSIRAALITHSHKDHCRAVADLIKAGIDCHMLQQTADEIGVSGHRVKIVEPKEPFRLGTWEIVAFETVHDVPSAGYLLANKNGEKVLYLTDSEYSPWTFVGVSHFLVEINFDQETIRQNVADGIIDREHYKRVIRSHFGLERAVEFFRSCDLSNTQGLWILHMSNENANAERIKRTLQEAFGKPVYLKTQGPPC